jgi:hypothetical protein
MRRKKRGHCAQHVGLDDFTTQNTKTYEFLRHRRYAASDIPCRGPTRGVLAGARPTMHTMLGSTDTQLKQLQREAFVGSLQAYT